MIPRDVSFFATKIRISLRKLNQNRKYFNLLVTGQWPRSIRIMKKTGGQKSRWTVPLINKNFSLFKSFMYQSPSKMNEMRKFNIENYSTLWQQQKLLNKFSDIIFRITFSILFWKDPLVCTIHFNIVIRNILRWIGRWRKRQCHRTQKTENWTNILKFKYLSWRCL